MTAQTSARPAANGTGAEEISGRPGSTSSVPQVAHSARHPMAAALDCARRGWRVVPLLPGEKRPRWSAWQQQATTDAELLRDHYVQHPDDGVGIATGAASGLLVLDVDGEAGRASLAALVAEHGALPSTRVHATAHDGRHYLFGWPRSAGRIGNTAGRLGTGLDTRGEGGQIVAPPTVLADGGRYRIEFDAPVADAPPWLVDRLSRPEPTTGAAAPDGPTFLDLDDAEGARVTRYARRVRGAEVARLDALPRPWREGTAWDATTYAVTCSLLDLADSPWAPYTREQAEADVRAHAPTDAAWGAERVADKIASARQRASAGHGKPYPLAALRLADIPLTTPPTGATARPTGRTDDHPGDDAVTGQLATGAEDDTAPADRPPWMTRLRDGGSFILDLPPGIPAIWGEGEDVLWPQGEALTITGSPGVGKSTLAGQVVSARLGIGGPVLGLPVRPSTSRVLYLAMDRPQQIARSLARQFRPEHRAVLEDRLVVWPGPPPLDLARHPETLLELALAAGADTVVIDSLKDAAIGLTDDEVGAGYNRARQYALAHGVEVLELHHMVKRGANGATPTSLADVYGSAWLTAGSGSVVLLHGEPGDPVVAFRHLKQPGAEVGPWQVVHDHTTGTSTVQHGGDVLALAQARGRDGITVKAAASALFGTDRPSAAQVEKARRKLDALTRSGHLRSTVGGKGGEAGGVPTTWTVVEPSTGGLTGTRTDHGTDHGRVPVETDHGLTERSRREASSQVRTDHGTEHGDHAPSDHAATPPHKGVAVFAPRREQEQDTPAAPAAVLA